MRLEDLFPVCRVPACPLAPESGPHKHVLDNQRDLIESAEKIVGSIGGYGSGKTVAAAVLGHLLSEAVPANRGLVLRRSYPKLYDSALRTFLEVVQRSGVSVRERDRRDGWPRHLVYPNNSEVFFRVSSDLGRLLGSDYGWAWIEEAIEEPRDTFDKLIGRVRLPHARKYLKVILTSNPPDRNHWIARIFGDQARTWMVTDPESGEVTTYRLIRSRTKDNPALPRGYIATLRATLTESEVQRVVEGEYGFSYEGKAVFSPPFDHGRHVGEFDPKRDVDGLYKPPMIRGWDFGYHAPAVTAHQMWVCAHGKLHWDTLAEWTPRDLDAEALATLIIRGCHESFRGAVWEDAGDAQGATMSDRGPGPIARLAQPPYRLHFKYRKCTDIDPGLALVRGVLKRKCPCGLSVYRVHRRCSGVINMLAGGYHYARERPGVETSLKPIKDGFYDNIADTIRYVGELIYRVKMIQVAGWGDMVENPRPQDQWTAHDRDPWTDPLAPR